MHWPWARVWALGFKMPLKSIVFRWHWVNVSCTATGPVTIGHRPFWWLSPSCLWLQGLSVCQVTLKRLGGEKPHLPQTHLARHRFHLFLRLRPPRGIGLAPTCKRPSWWPKYPVTPKNLRLTGAELFPNYAGHTIFSSITTFLWKRKKQTNYIGFKRITAAISQDLIPKLRTLFMGESLLRTDPHAVGTVLLSHDVRVTRVRNHCATQSQAIKTTGLLPSKSKLGA